jgi:alpha-L-rhamnosidase
MVETGRARSHPCHRPGARIPCPADKQTAYEVQAAETAERLKAGDLVWAFTANMVA